MDEPHTLASDLKAFIDASRNVGNLNTETLALLIAAKELFQLAPDAYIDVKRIPPNVRTIQGLFDYLQAIQAKIKTRPPGVSNQDYDVAQRGELKLYKLLVCAIHAIAAYLGQDFMPDLERPLNQIADDTIAHARTNAPAGLSQSGTTLWNATFSGAVPRTKACVNIVYYLLSRNSEVNAAEDNKSDDDTQQQGST
jgi:hypothetical protein